MLSVSSKGAYGLAAIFELGLHHDHGPMQIKYISRAQGIPQHYLEQLLVKLKKAGIVKSYRGAQGGYALCKNPAEIIVKDVLLSLEGPMEIVTSFVKSEALNFFWKDTQIEIEKLFQKTIQDLIMEHNKITKSITYNI